MVNPSNNTIKHNKKIGIHRQMRINPLPFTKCFPWFMMDHVSGAFGAAIRFRNTRIPLKWINPKRFIQSMRCWTPRIGVGKFCPRDSKVHKKLNTRATRHKTIKICSHMSLSHSCILYTSDPLEVNISGILVYLGSKLLAKAHPRYPRLTLTCTSFLSLH